MSREAEALALLERMDTMSRSLFDEKVRRIVNGGPKRTAVLCGSETVVDGTVYRAAGWALFDRSLVTTCVALTTSKAEKVVWLAGSDEPEPAAGPDAEKESMWPVTCPVCLEVYQYKESWNTDYCCDLYLTRALCEESSDAERAKRIVRDLEHFGVSLRRTHPLMSDPVHRFFSGDIENILDLAAESDDE